MILNKSQAEAVYAAICALNKIGNVDGRVYIPADRAQRDIIVEWSDLGGVVIGCGLHSKDIENYKRQSDFFAAYGLGGDAATDAREEVINPLDNTHLRYARSRSTAGQAVAERLKL